MLSGAEPSSGSPEFAAPCDVFLSYARADNTSGRITALAEQIKSAYREATGRELRVFFDVHSIGGGDDWQNRLRENLDGAFSLIACISPSYLESPTCEWEFSEFVKGEIARASSSASILPLYLAAVPGWEQRGYDDTAKDWVRSLRIRQTVDLLTNPWDVAPIVAWIETRVRAAEQAERSPGNLDRHNRTFTGRAAEMERLAAHLISPERTFTILHGVGGIGKTSLAIEYGHNFAARYPAGRWQASCAGAADLNEALVTIAAPLGIAFHEQEPAEPAFRAARVMAELRQRSLETNNGACLLILDGADRPELLTASQFRALPDERWLHVLITSQLSPSDLPDLDGGAFLPVDVLSDDDALHLIERHQPSQRFPNDEERGKARQIASLLGGYALAIEAAALFLRTFRTGGCAALLEAYARHGLIGFENEASRSGRDPLIHNERRLTATLRPILEWLPADELRTLELASLMPADTIVWEWLESLVGDEFNQVTMGAKLGELDRWTAIQDHLLGLRLITSSAEDWHGRMHTLIQQAIRARGWDVEGTQRRLLGYAVQRCSSLENNWENRAGDWEVEALLRWSLHLMELHPDRGGELEHRMADLLKKLGRWREEEPLRRHVLKVREELLGPHDSSTLRAAVALGGVLRRVGLFREAVDLMEPTQTACDTQLGPEHALSLFSLSELAQSLMVLGESEKAEPFLVQLLRSYERLRGAEHPYTLSSVNSLAHVYERQGRYEQAEVLFARALEASERVLGAEHPDTLVSVNNLAGLYERQGRYGEAEPMYRRALEAIERVLGAEHPSTLGLVNNLAGLYESQGRCGEAEPLFARALEASERVLGAEHPSTLVSVSNLGSLYERQGRYEQAKALFARALEASERVLGAEHSSTLGLVNNLAFLYESQRRYGEAEPLYRRAVTGAEKVLGPDHPRTKACRDNLERLRQRD